jgi:hypothetical protein
MGCEPGLAHDDRLRTSPESSGARAREHHEGIAFNVSLARARGERVRARKLEGIGHAPRVAMRMEIRSE